MADIEEYDDDDERKQFQQRRAASQHKSKTPVLDNFGQSFENIIENDRHLGFTYYRREKEIENVLKFFLKNDKQHVAIIGDYGTGRETLIKSVAEKIGHDFIPSLNQLTFKNLDLELLISGTKYQGQLEERIRAIYNELEKIDAVVYIKDLYSYLSSSNNDIKRLVRNKKIRIITIFTPEEAVKLFESDISLKKMFHCHNISPVNRSETKKILSTHITQYEKHYALKIDNKVIDEIIDYSNIFFYENSQPYRAISLLEEICASIELDRLSNPSAALNEDKTKFDKLKLEIDEVKHDKDTLVKQQLFEQAAALRDKEKKLIDELEVLKEEILKKRQHFKTKITERDIVNAINVLTGLDKDIIKKKEKIQLSPTIKNDNSNLPQYEFLQAQSILQGHQITIKRGLAFVLLPHTKEFEDLFHHNISPAFEFHGMTAMKGDSIYKPGNILSQIWSQIRSAEIIIADVSGQNANVIFELGLCYGIQRCPILLTRNPAELPFNIRNLRYIQYENTASGSHKLTEDLKTTIGEFLSAVRTENT